MGVERIEELKNEIADLDKQLLEKKQEICRLILARDIAEYYPDVELGQTVLKVGKHKCVLASFEDMVEKNFAERSYLYPTIYVRPLKTDGTPSIKLIFGGRYLKRYEG